MDYRERIEQVLERALQMPESGSARLAEAMRYSALGGGKRLRPTLVYTAGVALGAPLAALDDPAAAVELVHVYSLIHDDLPAMDDDDLRRGRPSCHRAYDEATAILAGDALQAVAFELLAGRDPLEAGEATRRLTMVRLLAAGIGTAGMAGGQAIDLESVGRDLDVAALQRMHRLKTGALIETSVLLGAAAAGVLDGPNWAALREYGAAIGLAFQIQDDILDVTGTTAEIGKIAGADAAHHKPTYTSLMGLDGARAAAAAQRTRAHAAIAPLGEAGRELAALADFVIGRAS
ncbi:MAG: polyprenyl synthetase family protein [Gammaproteobacteria bacterium]|nr:polyprenyl synthetase family protein [Gammaproteobacteria bacterium]